MIVMLVASNEEVEDALRVTEERKEKGKKECEKNTAL